MKFDVLTLFPEMFDGIKKSIIGRAMNRNLIEINTVNMRDFSKDKHKKVDDTVYGGGAGMLIRPDIVWDSYKSVKSENSKVIFLSPQGKTLNQDKVLELSKEQHLILLCGHYEGIDERVIEKIVDEEISIGDLAQEIIAQINPKARIVCDEQRLRPEKSEVNRLLGANAKIKALTKWEQKYTFAQGIAETIAWMRGNMGAYKADIYNV